MRINESSIPKRVWQELKEKWSQIKSPDDPNITTICAMCRYIEVINEEGDDCTDICPLDAKWCRSDTPEGILGTYERPFQEWIRNVAAFNKYIEYNIEHSE